MNQHRASPRRDAGSLAGSGGRTRQVMWISGIAWPVSWFCLGLEIFHWGHVTRTLRLNPPKVPAGYPKPRPGGFLLSVLAASALAPLAFLAAVMARWCDRRRHRPRADSGARRQPDQARM
jgi:hypothetical protein